MGRKVGAVSFLQILAPELNDRMLADFLDMESSLVVSMHVQSIDQVKAIKTVKRKITDLDRMKMEEQKKAVRAGYDMDILPSDLATYGSEAKKLLQDLQSRNERMFLLTFTVVNVADTKQQLDNNMLNQAAGDRQILAKQLNISPHQLSYVTHSVEGEGLLFYGSVILPFVDRFPKDTAPWQGTPDPPYGGMDHIGGQTPRRNSWPAVDSGAVHAGGQQVQELPQAP